MPKAIIIKNITKASNGRLCEMNQLGEMLLDHYEEYLGAYIDAVPYSDNKHQIQLLVFLCSAK